MDGTYLGALIRWLCRGCKTNFDDEFMLKNGWFKNVPILKYVENYFIAFIFTLILVLIVIQFVLK